MLHRSPIWSVPGFSEGQLNVGGVSSPLLSLSTQEIPPVGQVRVLTCNIPPPPFTFFCHTLSFMPPRPHDHHATPSSPHPHILFAMSPSPDLPSPHPPILLVAAAFLNISKMYMGNLCPCTLKQRLRKTICFPCHTWMFKCSCNRQYHPPSIPSFPLPYPLMPRPSSPSPPHSPCILAGNHHSHCYFARGPCQ